MAAQSVRQDAAIPVEGGRGADDPFRAEAGLEASEKRPEGDDLPRDAPWTQIVPASGIGRSGR